LARALIVGCGCRGRELGQRLLADGWQVRGTSRRTEGLAAIDAAGLEAAGADPARPGTVLDLVGDVAVVVWALGSARGEAEAVGAVHGDALERLLERLVDTPVRGFVYEACGDLDPDLLEAGARILARAESTWRIRAASFSSAAHVERSGSAEGGEAAGSWEAWTDAATAAVGEAIAPLG
jgi:hypothetical protein